MRAANRRKQPVTTFSPLKRKGEAKRREVDRTGGGLLALTLPLPFFLSLIASTERKKGDFSLKRLLLKLENTTGIPVRQPVWEPPRRDPTGTHSEPHTDPMGNHR